MICVLHMMISQQVPGFVEEAHAFRWGWQFFVHVGGMLMTMRSLNEIWALVESQDTRGNDTVYDNSGNFTVAPRTWSTFDPYPLLRWLYILYIPVFLRLQTRFRCSTLFCWKKHGSTLTSSMGVPGWCEPMVGTVGTCVWCAASAWFSGILLEVFWEFFGSFSWMSTLD